MDLPIHVPPLLFPAVSLLFLSYNGRFLTLASLIRSLHKEWREKGDPATLEQITSLRMRLRLIVWMQATGALSFVLAAVSTTCIFYRAQVAGHLTFGASLILLIASVAILLAEILVSTRALGVLLSRTGRDASPGASGT